MELKSGDFSAIESVVLAWLAGEKWKLLAYLEYQRTGDTQLEAYRVIARKMLQKPADAEINTAERQLGKGAELASGFGGSIGAWRRIMPNDPRSDDEIRAIIHQWRNAHPAVTKLWKDLARTIRIAIGTGKPMLVAPAPQPPIVAAFADGNLTLTLPSRRSIIYPQARFIPSRFEDAPPDVQFMDNARGQWKQYRGWFGTFVENVVQGTARDLLAAAIERFETSGIDVVFHCHDEVTVEAPIGSLSDDEFLSILTKLPDWATGLPLSGKVHSGAHYLAPPDVEAVPLVDRDPDDVVIEDAVDDYLDDTRDDVGPIDDPHRVERDDDEDFVSNLTDSEAPLFEMVNLPLTADNKVCCPFHDESEPSCAVYSDHFYCFGCGEHGDRIDWLTKVEGMTKAEAVNHIKDWPAAPVRVVQNGDNDANKLAFIKSIWIAAKPIKGTIAERYLDETRHIDVTKLPEDIYHSLQFHPRCVFGSGTYLPCLIALMRDPVTDEPVGIQRIALEDRDGTIVKLDMLGHAGVVKIWPAGSQLVVGEGLETVLAAATRIPYEDKPLTPAWALLSGDALKRLPTIDGVDRLIVLVDNDLAGLQASQSCAARWSMTRTVIQLTPDDVGADFNDIVIKEDANGAAI